MKIYADNSVVNMHYSSYHTQAHSIIVNKIHGTEQQKTGTLDAILATGLLTPPSPHPVFPFSLFPPYNKRKYVFPTKMGWTGSLAA